MVSLLVLSCVVVAILIAALQMIKQFKSRSPSDDVSIYDDPRVGGPPRLVNSDDSGDESIEDFDENSCDKHGRKLGTKKRKKLQAKAEKRRQRLRDEESRRERQLEADRRVKEEQLKEERLARAHAELEQQRQKEIELEQERRDKEYELLKTEFEIEEEGNREDDDPTFFARFLDDLKARKFVNLSDLTDTYHLRVLELADRVRKLLESNAITGVLDDRGNFLFISDEEISAIADTMKERGKFTLADVSRDCNRIIQKPSLYCDHP